MTRTAKTSPCAHAQCLCAKLERELAPLTALLQLEIIMSDKPATQRQSEPCDIPHAETTAVQETQAADKGELACSEPAHDRRSLSLHLLSRSQAQRTTSGNSPASSSTDGGESENDDATNYPKDEDRTISPPSLSSPENSNSAEHSEIEDKAGSEYAQLAVPPVAIDVETVTPTQATGSPSDSSAAMIPSSTPKPHKYLAKLLRTYVNIDIPSASGTCTSITDPRQNDRSDALTACRDPADEHRNPCYTAVEMANRPLLQPICTQQRSPSGSNASDAATSTVESVTGECKKLNRINWNPISSN